MSKLIINFLNRQTEKYNTTGYDLKVTNSFITWGHDTGRVYIPLCNIKDVKIEGYLKIIKEE